MPTDTLNYIIVTNTIYREISLVEKSLLSSLTQKIKPIQVILIDQNEKPLEISKKIKNNNLLKIQYSKSKSVSGARNELIIPSEADWIIFCDDDGRLDKDYSEIFYSYIANHKMIEVIAGSILREDTMDFYSLRHRKGGSLSKFHNSKNLMGSNFSVKVPIFNELGRFDDDFGAGSIWGSGEETDFCWKAFFSEKNMEFVPELKVIHVPPFNESLSKGFRKSFTYAVGKGALVAKWLFKKKKALVTIELLEMFLIPPLQIIRGIITLKIGLIINNFATLVGRPIGLIKYLFT